MLFTRTENNKAIYQSFLISSQFDPFLWLRCCIISVVPLQPRPCGVTDDAAAAPLPAADTVSGGLEELSPPRPPSSSRTHCRGHMIEKPVLCSSASAPLFLASSRHHVFKKSQSSERRVALKSRDSFEQRLPLVQVIFFPKKR